jgi:hypothetical protein
MKLHDLKSTIIDHVEIRYFYTREKNDINGNPRFRVYIIDPETPTVYEKIFRCYDSQIPEYIEREVNRK